MRPHACLALCAAALVPGPVAQAARYDGVVVDHLGEPVPAARIALFAGPTAVPLGTALTDGDGEFHVPAAAIGWYTAWARVEASGLATASGPLGTDRPARIVMQAQASGPLGGEVVDPDGAPIEGARVAAWSETAPAGVPGVAATDAQGRFAIAGLDLGAFTLDVTADGRSPVRIDGLRAGNLVPVRVTMAPRATATLELSVTGVEPGAVGYAVSERTDGARRAPRPLAPSAPPLGADGTVVLRGLPACEAFVNVDALDAWLESPQPVTLVAGQTARVWVSPRAASDRQIALLVVDRRGAPLAGQGLWIGDTRRGRVIETDAEGRASFRSRLFAGQPIGVRPAGAGIVPWDPTSDASLWMWEVPPEGAVEATLCAARTVGLTGFVRAPSGRPVGRRLVVADGRRLAWSDPRGRFEVEVPFDPGRVVQLAVRGADGAIENRARVTLPRAPDAPELVLACEAPGRVLGRVVDAEGRPVAGVALALRGIRADGATGVAYEGLLLSGPDGRFGFGDVPPGPWRVVAGSIEVDCEVRPEAAALVEVRL